MKSTQFLVLALMLNVLIGENSPATLLYLHCEERCLIQGIQFYQNINISGAIPFDMDQGAPDFKMNPDSKMTVENDGNTIIFTPKSSDDQSTLNYNILGNFSFYHKRTLLRIRKNESNPLYSEFEEAQEAEMYKEAQLQNPAPYSQEYYDLIMILIFQQVDHHLDDPGNTVLITFKSKINQFNPNFEPMMDVLLNVKNNGSQNSDIQAFVDDLKNLPFVYLTLANCYDRFKMKTYYFRYCQFIGNTTFSSDQFDVIKNITVPTNVKDNSENKTTIKLINF